MADYREQSTDAGVKLASTAAAATDQALVVALSPNSPTPTGGNTIGNVNMLDADVVATGTITVTDSVVPAPGGAGAFVAGTSTAGSYVAIAAPGGDSAWNVQITGLTSGALYFEGSLDSTNGIDGQWINVNGRQTGVVNTVLTGNSTTNGMYRGNTSGIKYFRVRSVGTLVGTPAIVVRLSGGIGAIFLNASIPAGTNSIGTVQPPTLTKGTQGATGVSTQDLKDSGRVTISMTAEFSPALIAEALLLMSISKDGATATTATSYVPTAGKRFRLSSLFFSVENTLGTSVQRSYLRYRIANTGGLLVTSPLQVIMATSASGTVKSIGAEFLNIPDGMEILGDGTKAIGFTEQTPDWVVAVGTSKIYVTAIGFEY